MTICCHVLKRRINVPAAVVYVTLRNLSPGFRNGEVYRLLVTDGLPIIEQLGGVGPTDNRPSTDLLHHFVQ